MHRSRFEVDVNRDREHAVYATPSDAWGLEVWDGPLSVVEIEQSIGEYDEFYSGLAALLDEAAERGQFVVLDIHSYNHRRAGPLLPEAEPQENPVINVGTRSLDPGRWGQQTADFMEGLRGNVVNGDRLDVRENVKFGGGNLSRWVNDRYEGRGFALAIEFKKVFMDEWTGAVDPEHLASLGAALEVATQAVGASLVKAA